MKRNMGSADRLIRTLIAVGIAVLYFTGLISGKVAIILAVVAVVFLLTSLVGRCPGYIALGISTNKEPPGSSGA
jgi:K+-transporting ATPase A subunit